MEFLDFKAISNSVPFKKMLDHFNIAYEEVEGQLKGEGFVVSMEKNLYFNPKAMGTIPLITTRLTGGLEIMTHWLDFLIRFINMGCVWFWTRFSIMLAVTSGRSKMFWRKEKTHLTRAGSLTYDLDNEVLKAIPFNMKAGVGIILWSN